jgi:hypothetical protein
VIEGIILIATHNRAIENMEEKKRIWLTGEKQRDGSGDPQHREQLTGAGARICENEANMQPEHANSNASFMATLEAKIVPYHASAGTFFD